MVYFRASELLQERDRLYRRYRRLRTDNDLHNYKVKRDLAHNTIESAHMVYYNDQLVHLSKTEDVWGELRHLGVYPSKPEASSIFSLDH